MILRAANGRAGGGPSLAFTLPASPSPSPTSSLPRNVAFNRASTLLAVVRNPRRFAATRAARREGVHRGNDAQIGRIISKTTTLPPPSPPPSLLLLLFSTSLVPSRSFVLYHPRALFRRQRSPLLSRTLVADGRQGMEYNPHRRRYRHRCRHRTIAEQPSRLPRSRRRRVTESSDYYLICRHGQRHASDPVPHPWTTGIHRSSSRVTGGSSLTKRRQLGGTRRSLHGESRLQVSAATLEDRSFAENRLTIRAKGHAKGKASRVGPSLYLSVALRRPSCELIVSKREASRLRARIYVGIYDKLFYFILRDNLTLVIAI